MNQHTKRLLMVTGAALTAAALSLGFAGSASADPDSEAASGTGVRNESVVIRLPFEGADHSIPRYQLKFDNGDVADIYCIDLGTGFGNGETYTEGKWEDAGTGNNTAKQNLPKILWALVHSTPNVSLADIKALPGLPDDHGATDERLGHLVRVATQAAIWHLSDGAVLNDWENLPKGPTEKEFQVVEFIYNYLTGPDNVGAGEEPPPTLTITPASATAAVGQLAGPFEIDAHAPQLQVTVNGGGIVDGDGNPLTQFEDGTKFWVASDKVGEATVKATGTARLRIGRVFLSQEDGKRYQKMILAGAARQEVSAQVTADFTPGLPRTGANVVTYVASGTGIAVLGVVVFFLARRRLARLRRLAS